MKNATVLLFVTSLAVSAVSAQQASQQPVKETPHMKITAMLYVDQVEPSLKFWTERLGFTAPVTVPDGDKIGFALLVKDGLELMLQSRHSMGEDRPEFMKYTQAGLNLYVEVPDFADLQKRMQGADIVEPVRTTFYGMQEIVVKEPGGNLVVFAAKAPSK